MHEGWAPVQADGAGRRGCWAGDSPPSVTWPVSWQALPGGGHGLDVLFPSLRAKQRPREGDAGSPGEGTLAEKLGGGPGVNGAGGSASGPIKSWGSSTRRGSEMGAATAQLCDRGLGFPSETGRLS